MSSIKKFLKNNSSDGQKWFEEAKKRQGKFADKIFNIKLDIILSKISLTEEQKRIFSKKEYSEEYYNRLFDLRNKLKL